jgi:hypothetical protein
MHGSIARKSASPSSPAAADVSRRFNEEGCVRLQGLLPASRLAGAREEILEQVERSLGASGYGRLRKLPVFQQITRLGAAVKPRALQDVLLTPALLSLVAELGDPALSTQADIQFLLSPPLQGDWTLQGLNWHVDVATASPDRLPGIQVFFLLDDVAPRGGATLALARSHRSEVRTAARGTALRSALRAGADADHLRQLGVEVVEMCGRAGDVFLMDMRVMHTPSINASKNLRMMATTRFLRQG